MGGGLYGGSVRQSLFTWWLPAECELWFGCVDVFLLPKPLELLRLAGEISTPASALLLPPPPLALRLYGYVGNTGDISPTVRVSRLCRGNSRDRIGRIVLLWLELCPEKWCLGLVSGECG